MFGEGGRTHVEECHASRRDRDLDMPWERTHRAAPVLLRRAGCLPEVAAGDETEGSEQPLSASKKAGAEQMVRGSWAHPPSGSVSVSIAKHFTRL